MLARAMSAAKKVKRAFVDGKGEVREIVCVIYLLGGNKERVRVYSIPYWAFRLRRIWLMD